MTEILQCTLYVCSKWPEPVPLATTGRSSVSYSAAATQRHSQNKQARPQYMQSDAHMLRIKGEAEHKDEKDVQSQVRGLLSYLSVFFSTVLPVEDKGAFLLKKTPQGLDEGSTTFLTTADSRSAITQYTPTAYSGPLVPKHNTAR